MQKQCCAIPRALLATSVLLSVAGGAAADVVELEDGSRLVGDLRRLADGTLLLQTQFAGEIEVPADKVVSIEVDTPVNVELQTGDRLVGPVQWSGEQPVVDSAVGPVAIELTEITNIWPEGAESPEERINRQQREQLQAEIEAARGKWSLTAELGFEMQEGNTDTVDFRGSVTLQNKSDVDLLRFYARGEYGEEDDVRNTSEVIGGVYYEHLLFTERLFAFARFQAEYDEFENLDLRFTTTAGVGYYWIKESWHELKTLGGIGYEHESFMNGRTEDDIILELGLDYRVDINKWLQFYHSGRYYPTFETVRDYRLEFDTGIIMPLGESDMWNLKIGMRNEYKSLPPAGVERLDNTYYANLLIDIK